MFSLPFWHCLPASPWRIFLPPDGVSCLNEGIAGCMRTLEISLLVYGPLFCIIGVLIGTPVFMLLLYLRD